MLSLATTPASGPCRGRIVINGKEVDVEWTRRAERALQARDAPLIVELELYFSCLVKKFVHFRADAGQHIPARVTEKLAIYFRPVTSTACSWDEARRRGRQPEIEIHTPVAQRLAPKRVLLDFRRNTWIGEYYL